MIELRQVSKGYRVGGHVVQALDEVSLDFTPGEFVSVVGPSGAGKSTLLHILGALDLPDSGSVLFNGRDITALNERDKAELRLHYIGFIFQFFNLLPTMSAWENVALPTLLGGTSLRAAKADAVQLLDRVGLANRAEHRPAELSGGEMQRVALARALIMDPALILADEPTGNLDSKTGSHVMSLLSDIATDASRIRSVVMVTHNPEAAGITNRIIHMHDGRVGDDSRASAT
jgi:putative ABC transport system ATP-binding protein